MHRYVCYRSDYEMCCTWKRKEEHAPSMNNLAFLPLLQILVISVCDVTRTDHISYSYCKR